MPFQVPGSPLKHVLKCRSPSTSFALGGEAHRLLLTKTAADPMVQLYDLATGEHVRDIETSVGDMHVTPSGTRLIVIDRFSEKSIKVSAWGNSGEGFSNTYIYMYRCPLSWNGLIILSGARFTARAAGSMWLDLALVPNWSNPIQSNPIIFLSHYGALVWDRRLFPLFKDRHRWWWVAFLK